MFKCIMYLRSVTPARADNTPGVVAINLTWRLIAMAILSHLNSDLQKTCSFCGDSIPLKRISPKTRFCSARCRNLAHRSQFMQGKTIKTYHQTFPPELSTGMKGAIGELIVSADLLLKGFDTYRAVSQSSKSDLVIVVPGPRVYRVEVTTGSYTQKGTLSFPTKDSVKFDILAVYLPSDNSIHYFSEVTDSAINQKLNPKLYSENGLIKK
jgi:endogenous inhibitor of DNA gyrase (YacG/DUF329 family)